MEASDLKHYYVKKDFGSSPTYTEGLLHADRVFSEV